MYPNPQDVLPLPPRPDLDQYKKRAKDLARAAGAGDAALLAWARDWIVALGKLQPEGTRGFEPRERDRRTHQLALFARERLSRADGGLAQAQFVIARAHGFLSWRKLSEHLESLARRDSTVAAYEDAADAIVSGDLTTLQRLLRANPALIRERSTREHDSTLLHYVSANGVEHYRQKTPPNILTIAECLLDAGAEVDAEANVYGGGLTTFALVVTSAHPRAAGVQIPLADLLLARGARMRPDIVHYALENGCPEAAAHLAALGAPLSLVDAAGVGQLEAIRAAFAAAPGGVPVSTQGEAMVMAGWCGQRESVRLMLELGVDPGVTRAHDQQTALHAAAFQGDVALVQLLLEHGAPVDAADRIYGTPPFRWAEVAWLMEQRSPAESYRAILLALARAGASIRPEWLEEPGLRSDEGWYAELRRAVRG